MYQVDENDKVIELKDVPQSSVGAPLPIVLSDERTKTAKVPKQPEQGKASKGDRINMSILS